MGTTDVTGIYQRLRAITWAKRNCFFCTVSIVRYFDRNVKKCFTYMNADITIFLGVSHFTKLINN